MVTPSTPTPIWTKVYTSASEGRDPCLAFQLSLTSQDLGILVRLLVGVRDSDRLNYVVPTTRTQFGIDLVTEQTYEAPRMSMSIPSTSNGVPTKNSTSTVQSSVPWYLWAVAFASTSVLVGVIWDISWHRTIGRDTFWTAVSWKPPSVPAIFP